MLALLDVQLSVAERLPFVAAAKQPPSLTALVPSAAHPCSWLDRSDAPFGDSDVWRGSAGEHSMHSMELCPARQPYRALQGFKCCSPPPAIFPPAHLPTHLYTLPQGLPYAMASQGWALGLCMLALATGASAYSAFLLAEVR